MSTLRQKEPRKKARVAKTVSQKVADLRGGAQQRVYIVKAHHLESSFFNIVSIGHIFHKTLGMSLRNLLGEICESIKRAFLGGQTHPHRSARLKMFHKDGTHRKPLWSLTFQIFHGKYIIALEHYH